MAGNLSDSTNRSPLWEVGYSTSTELYAFIRQLAWYRWWMGLGKDFEGEHPLPCLHTLVLPTARLPFAICANAA